MKSSRSTMLQLAPWTFQIFPRGKNPRSPVVPQGKVPKGAPCVGPRGTHSPHVSRSWPTTLSACRPSPTRGRTPPTTTSFRDMAKLLSTRSCERYFAVPRERCSKAECWEGNTVQAMDSARRSFFSFLSFSRRIYSIIFFSFSRS